MLRAGARADITVFDPDRFADRSTTFEPNRLATGVRHVFVNGQAVVRDGDYDPEPAPGRALRIRRGR